MKRNLIEAWDHRKGAAVDKEKHVASERWGLDALWIGPT